VTPERVSSQAAIRETYRIAGETKVTREDYLSGRVFPDAIAYCAFFIDLHTNEGGIQEWLEPGVKPTIPFSALVPKGSRHIIVAGRTVSSDRLANAGMREQPFCMAMGQAAGAAAALAVKQNVATRDVNIDELKGLLRNHDAIVPE